VFMTGPFILRRVGRFGLRNARSQVWLKATIEKILEVFCLRMEVV